MKINKNSIRRKLTRVFMIVFLVVFVVNAFIYYNLNYAINQIDHVYNSNIRLNDLSENLENIQSQLYQYLSTKSSEALENYYTYEQDFRIKLQSLNMEIVSESNQLMEKNIHQMSETYLDITYQTIEAKRGRNVTKYNEGYEESRRIYEYIQTNINSLNTTTFLKNAYNYSTLRSILGSIMIFGIVSLCIVIVLAIGWTVSMTGSITRPLVKLANAAIEIANGNMAVDFPIVETKDEISAVAKACNKMINSIRSYIEQTRLNFEREGRLIENELMMKNDLKEAQLKYLQAQINPHFLFNSLNAAAQLAMMEGAEKACMFIENMADFFRYNVRKLGNATTLREELQLVDNYIYILNVRFAGDIHYTKCVDERLIDIDMPGMILQPIIENAVNHGIREMNGEGQIQLKVYGDNQNICIRIMDNGLGIKQDIAKRIMQGEPVRSQTERESAGIGLDNVISRLKSYFERENVFEIMPSLVGTEVVIYLPKERNRIKHDENFDL
ncbi:MAG: sensor histidine kinase [Lachnospiraceae bacterium]